MVKIFYQGQSFKITKLPWSNGQKKRLDLRCELWGETNIVREKVVKEKVRLKL